MWRNIVGVITACVVLLGLTFGQHIVQVVTASADSRAAVNTQVAKILSEGDAADEIPVIIMLQSPGFARNMSLDPSSRQQRISAVRTAQRDFVGRNATRMQVMPRQPQLHPIVIVKMRRQDVATVAADSAVVSIVQDKPMRVLMDESTVIIGSAAANASGFDGTGTSVAVLDTGVKTDHEFLAGQVVAEACFSNAYGTGSNWYNGTSLCPSGSNTGVSNTNDVGSAAPCVGYSGCDHGTHVAGTVAGKVVNKGAYTLRGVAPGAKIIGIQVFTYLPDSDPTDGVDDSGISSWTADQIDAMDWLLTNMNTPEWGTLAALNMSLGGGESATTCDESNRAQKVYIDDLRLAGVATIIASGNDGWSTKISSPACISSAIAVGASTTSAAIGYSGATAVDQVASFSNAPTSANNGTNANGDRLLDLLAPGFYIYSATSSTTTSYAYKAGTSMATPHVAGAWAVMKQVAPDVSVGQILQWLYATGTSITDTRNSLVLPRINVDDAVALGIVELTTTPTPTTASTATSTSTPTRTFTRTATRTATRTVTPIPKPGAFNKTAPANNLTNRPLTLTLSWAASSAVTSYEYCLANTAAACTNWKSVGVARSVTVRGLLRNKDYYWNVRAKNVAGFTIANGGIWKFKTIR